MPSLLRSEEHTSELQSLRHLVCRLFLDRKSTRLNSSHLGISYAVFCLKKKKTILSQSRRHFSTSAPRFREATPPGSETNPTPNSSTSFLFFFFNDPATTEIYTLSLPAALPISRHCRPWPSRAAQTRRRRPACAL